MRGLDNLKLWFLLTVMPTVVAIGEVWLALRRRPRNTYLAALGHCYFRLARALKKIR
jgi:hypothetical protein